jgi:aconitate hydratase
MDTLLSVGKLWSRFEPRTRNIALRYLGLRAVIVKSFARICWQNLINFGIFPLTFENKDNYDLIDQGDILTIKNVQEAIKNNKIVRLINKSRNETYQANLIMSKRQVKAILAGGLLSLNRNHS